MPARCYIVPPHLLRGIAESSANTERVRQSARASLAAHDRVTISRKSRLEALANGTRPLRYRSTPFVPEHVLRRLAESDKIDEATRDRAKKDLEHLKAFANRSNAFTQHDWEPAQQQQLSSLISHDHDIHKDFPYRAVYDTHHSEEEASLPGKLIRAEGEPKAHDRAVNQAYDNVGRVLDFYKNQFQWNSIDNKNMDVISTVHFGTEYENAFWDPEKLQMVFGDGGDFLNNFTGCIDVIGHEMTHAITEHTSPLNYAGQAGALNEHISDVFGIMIKQKVQNEKSDVANWLVGEDCILPGVKGTALRSMKAPGTAYDDPRFGKDPQVANMRDFKSTFEDNGGVHIYSGIPNRAFYLASVAFGGYSWEKARKIWWETMNSGKVAPQCDFEQFADVTVKTAKKEFGDEAAAKVRKAWAEVGVLKKVRDDGDSGEGDEDGGCGRCNPQ